MNSFSAVPPKIKDYAVIGDCRSAALVSLSGSIDWLCWPRFDKPSIFAALLDRERGGHWRISPAGPFTSERSYVADTNVLQTRFTTQSGRATLTDLMPVTSEQEKRKLLLPAHEIIRELRCDDGEVSAEVDVYLRANYGLTRVELCKAPHMSIRADVGRGAYWLKSSTPMRVEGDHARATIKLRRGESVQFSLTYSQESPAVIPALGEESSARIRASVSWWQKWSECCRYDGPYREDVIRSALALKLLAYAPSGAIAAAPTTSLPELPGGDLNWDYRYCWLRDASLTVRAFLGLGYTTEAEGFLTWLLHATRLTQPQLRVMYTVFGTFAPHERDIFELRGYENSRPVRVGNGARNQLQMDIYGEVIDAAHQFARAGRRFDKTTQSVLLGLGKHVANNWDVPDEGIWEPRTGRKNHTNSRLMCWVALTRLLDLAASGYLNGVPVDNFQREQARIAQQLQERAWNGKLQTYASTLDGTDVDATLLRIPWYDFEPADSTRMQATYRRICDELGVGEGLVYRYKRQPPEGAFGICSFWVTEFLAKGGGTLEQACEHFEKVLRYKNDVGLFAEEIDPETGDGLGNFPQAFTHVGLISAALSLRERELGQEQPAIQHEVSAMPKVGEDRS